MKKSNFNFKTNSLLLVSLALAIAFLTLVFLSSCHKEGTPILDALDHQTTNDETTADSQFDDILKTAEEAVDSVINSVQFPVTISVGACAEVTADTNTKDITIDFGTSGCQGYDGRTRSGIIYVHYIGYYRDPNSSLTITLDNFTIDDISVEGSMTYNAAHRDANGHLTMSTNVKNGKLTYNGTGRYISWEMTKSLTWTEGENTGDAFDDVFEVTGNSSGVSTLGVSFTSNITSPITTKTACWNQYIFYPVSGVKEVKPAGFPTRKVDFGDGTCDKVVTITVNHDDYTVTLP